MSVEVIDDAEVDHLPISTHTRVLGVDITVHQQADEAAQRGMRTRGELGPKPEIEAPVDFRYRHSRVRRDLAVWARRSLFSGAKPGDGS